MGKQRPARFNRFSIGRAAALIRQGKTIKQVADYYFSRYGAKWGITSPAAMEEYLFGLRGGNRPQFRKLADSVRSTFNELLSKQQELVTRSSQNLKRLHREPGFKQRHAERSRARLQKMQQDPEFKRRQAEKQRRPEARKRMAKIITDRAKDPAYRAKISEGLKKRWQDPQFRAKMTAAAKERWKKPAQRERQANILRERWSDSATRQRQSEKIRQHWQDPKWRRQVVAMIRFALTKPKIRNILSEAAKRRWQDPQYRQTQLAAISRATGMTRNERLQSQREKDQKAAFDYRTRRWEIGARKRLEADVIQAEEHDRLMTAVHGLPENELEAVVSVYFMELPERQVAQQMGVTPETLKEVLTSAYKRMFKALRSPSS